MFVDNEIRPVETNNLLKPVLFIVSPAIIISLCITGLGFIVYKEKMNLFELVNAIYAHYYIVILTLYTLVLPLFFPFTLNLFKSFKISLAQKITSRKTLFSDIFLGILTGISSYIFFFLDVHVMLKMPVEKTGTISLAFFETFSLVIISAFFKELYFKGIPFYLLKDKYGEWKTFLFGNLCFTILDWPNFGLSFFLGLIWYLFFRKNGSLIIPVIGHALFNFLGILARAGALSFLGIIPV